MELLKKVQADAPSSRIAEDPRARKILATGLAASAVIGSLLAGLALVVFSLRDLHLLIELKKDPQ